MNSATNSLFLVPIRLRRGSRSRMPPHLVGAMVDCFVSAPDHLTAVRMAAARVQQDGDIFEDLVGGQVHQLDPATWPSCLARKYLELADQLPPQPDVTEFLTSCGVFFGPFAAWELEA